MKSQLLFKPTRRITYVLLVASALAAGMTVTYSVLRFRSAEQISSPPPLATRTPEGRVAAVGYLEPQGEVIKLSAPAFTEGTRINELLVHRGDQVKAKQVVAILDNRDRLQAALEQAQTQVIVSQARLAQVKAGAKKGDIKAAVAKFQGTQAELEGQIATQKATIASLEAKLLGERSAQEATIDRIKAELENSQTDCERYQGLYKNGAVTDQQRDKYCLLQQTNQESLKEAQANLQRIVNTYQQQIAEAKANLNRTIATNKNQIGEAEATLNSVAEVRPVDVQVAQAELQSSQAAVKRAQADLDLAYVRSPRDGQILKIHTWPGELVGNQGIVDLGQTAQMYVTAEVYETDISQVCKGQEATINTNGMTKELNGTVEEVAWEISKKNVLDTDPIADADARVVEVKIRLNPKDSEKVASLTNLKVTVVIDTTTSQHS